MTQQQRDSRCDHTEGDRKCVPGISFLRAIAAALWDSYSTKAKPRFLVLSVELGYTITSTTPSVTWTTRAHTTGGRNQSQSQTSCWFPLKSSTQLELYKYTTDTNVSSAAVAVGFTVYILFPSLKR